MPKRASKADETMAQALRKPTQEETRSYYERIRELIEAERVPAARKLLAEALEKGDHDEDLSGWQRVLAPAKVLRVGGERDIDRTADIQWLGEHAKEYQKQWVALLGGELLAHSASLEEVVSVLKINELAHPPLVHYINIPPEPAGLAKAKTYSEKIQILVEADWVGAARNLLAEALERGDHGEDLSGWQRVLAPAKTIRRSGE
jgi:hypothetical protein